MHVISSFDHSIYVELAVTALVEEGIPKHHIFSVSLDKRAESPKMFDTIHRSDGVSLFDTGAACATALAVIGSSYGFILKGGPIMWGCIGAVVGFCIGFGIDVLVGRKKKHKESKAKTSEVVILVDCSKEQVDRVETILWKHYACGVAKVGVNNV
jgi:ribosomal protein L37AE/L43A